MSMRGIGGNMFFFGAGSIILNLINMEFILLMWIDLWGPQIGWAIRIGLCVIGAILWLTGQNNDQYVEG